MWNPIHSSVINNLFILAEQNTKKHSYCSLSICLAMKEAVAWWQGGQGAMAPLNRGANGGVKIRGRQNCLLVIYLARIVKIDRTLVEHFAVTCCEQSNKTCESTFVSYVFVLTMYVASSLARQLTKILRMPKMFSISLHSES